MWLAGTATRIIAETLGISADQCDVIRRRLELPKRKSWHNAKPGYRRAYLPTPEEIQRKCLEFQSRWTDEERARRWVGPNPALMPVEVRVISAAQISRPDGPGSPLEDLADSSGG